MCVGVGKCSESWTRPWVQDDWVMGQSCFGQESFYSTYPPFKALDNSMNLISSLGQRHLPLQVPGESTCLHTDRKEMSSVQLLHQSVSFKNPP